MKELSKFIQEKLHVSDYKKSNIKEKIIEVLYQYFQNKIEYKGVKYNSGFELLDKKFDKDISNLLDRLGDYPKLYNKVGISFIDFTTYIEENNDKLYKEIKNYTL